MTYQELILFLVVVAIGETIIIVGLYKEIQALRKKINDAVNILNPKKPKKKEEPKKPHFYKIKLQ